MPPIARRVVSVLLGLSTVVAPAAAAAGPPGWGPTATNFDSSLPTARNWSELVRQLNATEPDDAALRSLTAARQTADVMRCFGLEDLAYCLGFGFVDQTPTAAQLAEAVREPVARIVDGGQATGDLSPRQFVAERAGLPRATRLNAELAELRSAWDGRAKARSLRAGGSTTGSIQALPDSNYIMTGYQTSQELGYWCGPATFQSIDWADDDQKDTQASWASDLGTTTSGTSIAAMVEQTNVKTDWDVAASAYIVQSVANWTTAKFLEVHQNHLGDGAPAPVIEHPQLLKRYFPYLAFNHSGHFQVGRGYNQPAGTIGIFEVFDERRFNSNGNDTDGPKNVPASAMFNATLANQFKNIGL